MYQLALLRSVVAGAILRGLYLHPTLGLGAMGLGASLTADAMAWRPNRRASRTVKDQTPLEVRPPQLRKSLRTLIAILIVLLVGAAAFYGTIYLAHNQTPSVSSGSSSSTSSSTTSSSTTSSVTSVSSGATSTTFTAQTETSFSATSQEVTTTPIESTTLTSTQSAPGVVLVIIPSGAATNSSLDFEPATITVVLGVNNTIMWRNEDSADHSVHITTTPFLGAIRSSPPIMPGMTYSIKLNDTGTYEYQDGFYPQWMEGTIIVLP